MQHVLEIHQANLENNLHSFRDRLSPNVKLMAMVKADCYGLGIKNAIPIIEGAGVDYLGVAYISEAIDIRRMGSRLPIAVLNPSIAEHTALFEFNLEPEVFSKDQLLSLIENSKNYNTELGVHIKVDTGMRRLGFSINELKSILPILKRGGIIVKGISTHLTSAGNVDQPEISLQQIELFKEATLLLTSELGYPPLRHILNSAGLLANRQSQFDMIRLGIGMYGAGTKSVVSSTQPVCTLKAQISQIKTYDAGEFVGYNRQGRIINDGTSIATVAIGYADGIFRSLGNGVGHVWITGSLAPIIGEVCMDMLMVDVTGINCKVGDYVEFFGSNYAIGEFATSAKTIPYEVLTSIGNRVQRIVV